MSTSAMPGGIGCRAFLVLAPDNPVARTNFEEVAAAIEADPSNPALRHAGQYMLRVHHGRPHVVRSGRAVSATTSDSEADVDEAYNWTGHYQLCLCRAHRPIRPRLGWQMGFGRSREPRGGVELRLALEREEGTGMASKHARVYLNRNGIFLIRSDHPRQPIILLQGNPVIKQRVLDVPETTLTLGEFRYTLTFTDWSRSAQFRTSWEEYLASIHEDAVPNPAVSPTPLPTDIRLQEWTISETVGKGSFGAVAVAVNRDDGSVMAAKRLEPRRQHQMGAIRDEVNILKALPDQIYLPKFIDVIYEKGSDDPSGWVYIFTAPLARCTLHGLTKEMNETLALQCLAQILDGLAALHEAHIVHRDMKLGNVGVVSTGPLQLVLFDFSLAIITEEPIPPRPGSVGTIGYLAPELESRPYGSPVDVYATGMMAALMLLRLHHPPNPDGLRARNTNATADLVIQLENAPIDTSTIHLVGDLMHQDPQRRPSAASARQHWLFQTVPALMPAELSPAPGDKRPRIPSSDAETWRGGGGGPAGRTAGG
ncbi:MAG: hypothetical protein M1823_002353 [Watsoniomyces obsoletus]|nr:MAG: hypothetical protein M1823_002353 [Watsoniomyces obsoletus]